MNWWANACEFICIKDTAKGMFYDQVHLNLLPVYFEHVGIARHKGCNVANWNMVECKRSLNKDGASVIIAGEFEIIFIHFSQSTINGIENGTDPLLRPYLEQYVASVNLYNEKYKSQELIMPEVIVKKTENEKSSTLQILKKSVKRMLKK